MENLKRRGLSLLLALVMIVSLFAGIQLPQASAATVNYVTDGDYVYNWGTRGTTATYLSPMAEAWYSTQGTSYDALSALSGSSTESSVPSSALYKELQSLMDDAQTYTTTYDATKTLFQYTDCENSGSPKTISSFYSGKAIGPSWDGSWNREHTWPNSKGDAAGSGENDIMMLRPTSSSENSSRGNTAYGQSSGFYDPNSESSTYDLRGDVARIILFVYVRWNCTNTGSDYNPNGIFGTDGVFESKAVLLDWMEEDPVDTWELGRNDSVESITGTRNVFVDYPELAFELFETPIPSNYSTPSGIGGVNYTINATSSNTSHGTVSVSGRTITAIPAEGYYASGYTVTNGQATVTQDGNTFSVSATDDCTIQINFAAKTAVTVTFMENGTVGKTVSGYAGDAAAFPALTNTTPSGYTFHGWINSSLAETTEKPEAIYTVGDSYTPTANTTYYALYVRNEGGSGDSQTVAFELGENTAASHGDGTSATSYSETANGYTLSITNGSTFYINANDATGNSAIKLGSGNNVGSFTFTVPEDVNSVIISAAQYKSSTSMLTINGTTYTLNTASDDGSYTDITVDTSTTKTVTVSTTSSGKRAMINSISYITGTAGTTYYTTSTCAHSGGTTNVAQQDATCTEAGYTAGVKCNVCGGFISGHEVIPATNHPNTTTTTVDPTCTAAGSTTVTCDDCGTTVSTTSIEATGHSYTSVVTPPTATEKGYTTHTCSACGDSYVDSYTDALGETFTVSFSVPGGVTAIADMACNNTGITLPTPVGSPTGEYTYTFLGWVTADVNNVTDKPGTIYKAGETFTATANTTLIALYTYVVAGESTGTGDYVKVTTAPADWSGEYVIVYEDESFIFDGSLETLDAVSNYQSVTISNNTITAAEGDPRKFAITAVDTGYAIQSISGYYIGNGSDSNGLTSGDTALVNTISINDDGTVNIIGSGGAYLRFNTTSGQDRFRYFKSGTYTSQKAICLYVKDGVSGTAYYTTVFCEHTGGTTAVAGKDATCTEDGYEAGTKCTSCGAFVSGGAVIPATGHVNTTTTTVDATCNQAGSITVTCACGEVVSTEEIPATGNHSYVDGVCSICGTAESSDGINYGPLKENTAYTMYVVQKTLAKNLYFTGEAVASNEEGSFLGTSDTWSDSVDVYVEYTDTGVLFYFYTKDTNTKTYIQIFINSENSPRAQFVTDSADIVPFVYNEEKELYLVTLTDGNGYTNDHYWGSYQGYSYIRASSTYYLSDANPTKDQQYVVEFCTHDVKNTVTVEPTCTEDGSEKVVCEHCLAILKETVLPALGHNFVNGVCTRCGLAQLTVTFVTPAGVTAVPAISFIEGESVTLPTATGTPTDGQEDIVYTFVGWSAVHIDNVKDYDLTVETYYPIEDAENLTFSQNTTLYAVYTYSLGGSTSSGSSDTFELVTSAPESWDGEYVLASATGGVTYVFLPTASDPNATAAAQTVTNAGMTLSGTTLTGVTDDYVLVIKKSGDNYIIGLKGADSESYLSMKSNANAGLSTSSTSTATNALWAINFVSQTEITFTNKNYTSRGIRFNPSSKQFRTYTSGQTAVYLYANTSSGSTGASIYHTTIFTTEECQHTNTTTESQAATCTEDGYEKVTCNDCGTTVKYEVLIAGHTNVYTDNGDGTHTHACSVCQTVVVAAEKHTFDNTTGRCVYCNAADTLRFHAASLTIEEGISVNFKAKTYLFDEGGLGYSDPYAVFVINNLNFKVTNYKVENGYYVFTLYNVRPDWMGDNIDATLYANRDGAEQTGETKEYSIYTYCNTKLNEIVTAAEADRDLDLAKLLVDVLNYGAATQTYTGHNTDSLVNANLGYAVGWGTTGTPTVTSVYGQTLGTGVTESATWNGAALFLRETTRVRLRFATDDITGVTVNATVGGVTTSISTFRDAGNGNYYVFFDDLLATQMGETITFTIAKDGVAISKDLTYSAESYVVSAVSAYGADSALCQMLYAMIHYGNAAEAYATASAN